MGRVSRGPVIGSGDFGEANQKSELRWRVPASSCQTRRESGSCLEGTFVCLITLTSSNLDFARITEKF